MAQQTINVGTTYDDDDADAGRDAFDKVNDNFTELYQYNLIVSIGAWNMDTTGELEIDLLAAIYAQTGIVISASAHLFIESIMIQKDGSPGVYNYFPLNYVDIENSGSSVSGSYKILLKSTIKMYRLTGGFFDSADFDTASNRGYIKLTAYIPV